MVYKKGVRSYDLIREGEEVVLRVDYEDYPKYPSLEDDPFCMSDTIDKLVEAKSVTKIVLAQKRDYEYDYNQTQMLLEIAKLFTFAVT